MKIMARIKLRWKVAFDILKEDYEGAQTLVLRQKQSPCEFYAQTNS